MTLIFALHSIYLHFFIIFTHFCVAAHKLTFSWIFFFFRSLMTIIELNNCPLFSLSLDLIFLRIFPHIPRNPLALTQNHPFRPQLPQFSIGSDLGTDPRSTLRCQFAICTFFICFYLKRARGFILLYNFCATSQPEQTTQRCVDLGTFLLLQFFLF